MNGAGVWTRLLLALLLAAGLAACGGGGGGGGGGAGDVTPPTVTSTQPVDVATGVARSTAVAVTFSEAMAPASLATAITLSAGALNVPGTVSVSGATATFTPLLPPLALNTLFTLRVSTAATDLAGNPLAAPLVRTFTTETVPWPGTRQFGTVNADTGNAVATDADGNIYVAGTTGEDLDGLGGDPYVGVTDLFLAKFSPAGALLFTRQFGTVAADAASGVAVDGSGNVYVTGTTGEDLDGAGGDPYVGGTDVFLARFRPADPPAPAGTLVLSSIRQFGTVNADAASGVAVDGSGNVFVTGTTGEDLDGTGGDPYAGGTDLFLARFRPADPPAPAGAMVLSSLRQLGTVADDAASGVAVDGTGNVFVTGTTAQDLDGTGGDPYAGGTDVFLARFRPADPPALPGTMILSSIRQFGTVAADEAFGVAVDGLGNVYMAGTTAQDLDGPVGDPFVGGTDLFLAKFSPAGLLLFTRQLGTVAADEAFGVAVASLAKGSNVFVTGETSGSLDGITVPGGVDVFLTKFDPFGNLQ